MSEGNAITEAAAFCHEHLFRSKRTLDYLRRERGLNDAVIAAFRLGLFPRDLGMLFPAVSAIRLREHGIIRNASNSLFQTWRLVLPITDVRGRDVAFAGRLLPWEEPEGRKLPKYMNTVYPKTRHLFGLSMARREIALSGCAYVVEGYFDAVRAHQEGLRNTVACCGTSFSKRQFALLARYASDIVLLFDNDEAGQASARTHVRRKQHEGVRLSTCNPFAEAGVKDLDEFLGNHPASAINGGRAGYRSIRALW